MLTALENNQAIRERAVPIEYQCQCKCGHCFDCREAPVQEFNGSHHGMKYRSCPKCGSIGFHYLINEINQLN